MKNKYVLLHQIKIGLLLRPNVSIKTNLYEKQNVLLHQIKIGQGLLFRPNLNKLKFLKNIMFCYIKLKLGCCF